MQTAFLIIITISQLAVTYQLDKSQYHLPPPSPLPLPPLPSDKSDCLNRFFLSISSLYS